METARKDKRITSCEVCSKPFIVTDNQKRCSYQCRGFRFNKIQYPETISLEDFMKQVEKTDTCWLWTGKTLRGYGRIHLKGHQSTLAHRLSWELHFGVPPKHLAVCHTCDNPPCVRPDHLWLGTKADNMWEKGRGKKVTGETNGQHKLTWEIVRKIRSEHPAMTCVDLAKKYGTVQTNVQAIVKNKTWKEDQNGN